MLKPPACSITPRDHRLCLLLAGIPASGIDVSGPKTAPGATKSFLPKSGFAALGGGPDYSTVLSFDNFSVAAPILLPQSGGSGGSICHGAAPVAGMDIVAVPCGLDVPGLAFDIDEAAQRIMLRSDHSLCIGKSNSSGSSSTATTTSQSVDGSGRLVLQACMPRSTDQAFVYDRAKAFIYPATSATPSTPSPWATFTPGEGVPYGAGFKAGDTLTGVPSCL